MLPLFAASSFLFLTILFFTLGTWLPEHRVKKTIKTMGELVLVYLGIQTILMGLTFNIQSETLSEQINGQRVEFSIARETCVQFDMPWMCEEVRINSTSFKGNEIDQNLRALSTKAIQRMHDSKTDLINKIKGEKQ